MKKILCILSMVFLAGSFVQAEQPRTLLTTAQNRTNMVRKYLEKKIERGAMAEKFLTAVKKGNLEEIASIQDLKQVRAKDKFGNNCFHLAPNANTLQAVAAAVRRLAPDQVDQELAALRNGRNQMGETPLMAHINAGRTDTFRLLYEKSELQTLIRAARSVNKGGALADTAQIKQNQAIEASRDNSGRTVAQAAQAMVASQIGGEEMKGIVRFFERQAPYLL